MAIPILDEESTEQFLSGGGEMGKLIRTMDWANTPLGPISSWPQSLRTSVSLCLSSTFPILIAWGPETIQIYNDSYRPICGAKHPESMGQNFRICWETALPVVGDKFTRGQQGEGTYITDQRMFLDRYGYLEESFMTFSFAPIRDESGGVGGIFHPITESTEKMLGARRTQALKDLGAGIGKAKTIEEIGTLTVSQYENYQLDIPFLSFYTFQNPQATLVASSGVQHGSELAPATLYIDDNLWQLKQVVATGAVVVLDNLSEKFGEFACEPYEEPPVKAVILPVHISGQSEVFGFLIAGVSARRALDQAYLNFYEQLVGTYNTAVSNVYAYEQEQKRAEALAAIDRSKTAFFSNVSHEFRTPLTLMLGPLEELLQKEHLDEGTSLQLEATHRNALRLLKLVNNLLDYSRVEAGRTTAVYQPVNLFELTVDLASSFRSIIEKAGMQLIVSCEPLQDVFYVDKQMWEKVVLNLLSNAFKYTLQGTITVELKQIGQHAVLKVIDTGVGIPEKELPHMFERFHRIENTAGRTHEGTGIGLSLVHELIQLHGGTITVDSVEGKGSIFTVQLASGKAHLPKEHVIETTKDMDSSSVKGAFIKEAYGLLQEDYQSDGPVSKSRPEHENKIDESISVLVVDDNADMRNYLQRLLNPYYTVNTAVNGQDAIHKIEQHLPDLVLSDMMMPVMDGKALLSHLRAQHDTSRLPVIFLSARAGEEARIDGLAAGADDYLVKPFSASELLAKVQAQIHINKTRGNAEQQLRSLFEQAPVAIAVYRGSDHIVEVANEKMLSYWGKSLNDVMEQPVFKVMDTLADQGFKDHMDQVYLTGQPYIARSAQAVLHRFGQIDAIYLDLTIEPLRDDKGQIIGTITVAADVTEQTEFRKTIEKAKNTLQLAIEASNVGIWQAELQTGKLHLSAAARQIYGLHTEEPLTFDEILPRLAQEDGGIQVREAIDSAIKSKGKFHENYQIQPFDSSPKKWVNINGMVELDSDGQATSIIGTILDITESKEDELRKNDFIGMVSHELKTPLTSLTGYTQLGLRSSTKSGDTQLASIFERATIQVRKMTNMINGFLSVAQLESGKINLKISQFNTSAFVNETLEDVKLVADGQEFELEVQDITLHADRDKLATVLTNLLTNAIKYGEKGKPITISCLIHSDNLLISVKNSGMGINANNLDRLFDRFFREERTQTQHISGFGIGLYLCAEIIRRHHGKIWAESEPGVETTFFFEIPLVYTKALESN